MEALQPQPQHPGLQEQAGDQPSSVAGAGQVCGGGEGGVGLHVYIERYFGTQRRNDFVGSVSSGCATDFRHYNYRQVPYLGGSDHYSYLNKTVTEARALH